MANPILKVYLSHAPDAPAWALDGVVEILRNLQLLRGKPYELVYGYAPGHGQANVVPNPAYLRHGPADLTNADLVFVIVTDAYFTSEYINMAERPLIEERFAAGAYAGVIPILIEPANYAYEWLAEHRPRTITFGAVPVAAGADNPVLNSQQWLPVSEKIAERLLGVAAVKRSRQRADRRIQRFIVKEAREEAGYGPWPYVVFLALIGLAIAGSTIDVAKFFAGPRRSAYVQERTFQAGLDLATRPLLEQSYAPGTRSPGTPDPDPDFPESVRPDRGNSAADNAGMPDTYDTYGALKNSAGESNQRSNPLPSNPVRSGTRGQSTQPDLLSSATPPGEENSVDREGQQSQPSNRQTVEPSNQRSNEPTNNYGRYESCQGYDENGYRPCKLNQRWYIVNESRNIHHLIDFPVSTHEDIYAIRPFDEGIASVFYFRRPERQMYRSFCVALNDAVVDCK